MRQLGYRNRPEPMTSSKSACTCPAIALYGGDSKCSFSAACAKGALSLPGLSVLRYPNAAYAGNFDQSVVPTLSGSSLRWPADEVFSLEILGTLTLPPAATDDERWLIECDASGGSFFLWLDDHLVCEAGNNQPRWNPYRLEPVLPFTHTRHARDPRTAPPSGGGAPVVRYFLRATFVHSRQHILANPHARPFIDVRWQRSLRPPVYIWGKNRWAATPGSPPAAPVPRGAYSTAVPAAQQARLTLQREMLMGYWATWSERSVTAHTLLPFGVELRLGLCVSPAANSAAGAPPPPQCEFDGTKAMVDDGRVRLGVHASDHSYTALHFAMATRDARVNVSIETAQRGRWGPLFVLATPVAIEPAAAACRVHLVVSVGFMAGEGAPWQLPGTLSTSTRGGAGGVSITAESDGLWRRQARGGVSALGGVTVRAATGGGNGSAAVQLRGVSGAHLALPLGKDGRGAGVWASRSPRGIRTLQAVADAVKGARIDEARSRARAVGGATEAAEVAELGQAAVMWNSLSRASLPGPATQCARGWGRPWVAFMWDDVSGSTADPPDTPRRRRPETCPRIAAGPRCRTSPPDDKPCALRTRRCSQRCSSRRSRAISRTRS